MRAAAFSLAVGLVLADSSVAVLALPAIYRELEVDLGDLHWVLTTFNLVLALVAIPAARVTRRAGAVRTSAESSQWRVNAWTSPALSLDQLVRSLVDRRE